MKRIELELYAERLAGHAERVRDEIETARLHLSWAELEDRARQRLAAGECAVLEALGALACIDAAAERRLIERRVAQLRVVERLQALVEEEIEATA